MKRLISLVMVLVLMLGSLALVPVNAAQIEDIAETSASKNWYNVYKDAIEYGYYAVFGNTYYSDKPLEYFLHDLDYNGIPELIISNGSDVVAQGHIYYVHTATNGYLSYCGSMSNYYPTFFYNMNSGNRGLYCWGGRMGVASCEYYSMSKNSVKSKNVLYVDDYGTSKKTVVYSSSLYKAYKTATKVDKDNYYFGRTPRYPVKAYTLSQIRSMGYKNFVGKYQYLAIPKIKDFDNVNGGVKITWNKVKGAAKYRLYRKTKSGWTKVATTSKTSYTHKISKSNTTYTYTVRCVSSDGTRNTSRFVGKGYKHKYIATPKPRSIKNSKSGIRFEFSRVSGAPKYRIFRKTSGSSWRKVADVSSKKNYYFDKTAKKGVRYTYTVRCVSSSGKSFVSGFSKKGLSVTRK